MTSCALIACWLLVRVSLLGQLQLPTSPDPAPTRATTSVAIPTSQPTTQQVNLTIQTAEDLTAKSLYESVLNTELGKIIQGKKELTFDDIRKPGFWVDTIRNLVETLLAFIPRFIGTLAFLFVFWLIYRGIRRMAVGQMKQGEVDTSIRDMLASLIKWCVMGFGVVIACNQLGIPIVAMLTGVSIIGLAVGFAAQETLANFIAGVVIFLDKPFKPGEWIEIDGTFGQVKRVSFRSTRLLNLDGEMIVFPNTHMLSNRVANHSAHAINRVSIPIGISYKASIDAARDVLVKLTEGDPRVVKKPAPEVVVSDCGASSVNLLLRFWIEDEAVERAVGYEYTEKCKKALDEAGIEIPFPHVQLLLEKTPALEELAKSRPAA